LPDVIVPVGPGPAAVLKPAIAIFILAAGCLDHAVQRNELGHNELSHGMRLRDGTWIVGVSGALRGLRTGPPEVFIHTSNERGFDRQRLDQWGQSLRVRQFHDGATRSQGKRRSWGGGRWCWMKRIPRRRLRRSAVRKRSEEHTSELQSLAYLVCR